MDEIRVIFKGKVQPKERPRCGRNGHFYTPKKTHDFETAFGYTAKAAMKGKTPCDCPLRVVMFWMRPVPKSWSKKKRAEALGGSIRPTTKPDVDNAVKGVLDACNCIVWTDDSLICSLQIIKTYAEEEGVVLHINSMEGKCA